MRPPRGPAGRGRPSPCPAVSALGGAGSRRDAGTRVGAAGHLGTRVAGSSGCQGARGPGRREGRGRGWQQRMQGAFFFSSSHSFVELAVAAKLPGESRWFAVGTTKMVTLGALGSSNPV